MPAAVRRRTLRERIVGGTARLAAGFFFRSVEVDGAERVPPGGPLVIVSNHANGTVDPALLAGYLPVTGRPLAVSNLWANPFMRPFLALGGAIPVKRRLDGAAPGDNDRMFASCHEALRRGRSLMVFPEGLSHDESHVLPLKTGVARIVLESEAAFGPLGARIVPVGLVYDAKQLFRSRALLVVGEPLDPAPELATYAADSRESVRVLTARVEAALAAVAPHHESWEQARLLRRAAGIFDRPATEVPEAVPLAERHRRMRMFAGGYRALRAEHPELVAPVEAELREYDARLDRHGLLDGQVAARYPWPLVLAHTVRFVELALLDLPAAALGSAVNWVPYRAAGRIASGTAKTLDSLASFKLYSAVVLFPAWWLILAAAAGLVWGGWFAALAAFLGPLSAWQAMRFHDRRESFQFQARGFLLLRRRPDLAAELRARRAALHARITDLVHLYRAQTGPA